jgi:predicted dehydrogenase
VRNGKPLFNKESPMSDRVVRPVQLAQIGYGYWGPNLARNFYQLPDAKLAYMVDANPAALERAARLYGCRTTTLVAEAVDDPTVEAVVIATPARTHFELVQTALLAGKHVFVEKPLAMSTAEARTLVELAEQKQRTLMVGHVFEYNPAVHFIKTAIQTGELGEVYYLYSRRVNLGRVQSDVNALWSIAPHDVSIALYLLDALPEAVSCQGASCLNGVVEDVIFLTLHFPGNVLCHIHVSWLDPSKVREMTVVGSRKMIIYDDVSAEGKVRIYDKGVYRKGDPIYGEFQYKLHSGDILIPRIDMQEPLALECAHFVDCIRTGQRPQTDGENGLRVVAVLAAGQESLAAGGTKLDFHF